MGKVVRSDPQSLITLPKPGPFHSQSLIIGSWELRNKMTGGVSLFPAAKLLTLIHTGGLGGGSRRGRAGKGALSVQANAAALPSCCLHVNGRVKARARSPGTNCPLQCSTAVRRKIYKIQGKAMDQNQDPTLDPPQLQKSRSDLQPRALSRLTFPLPWLKSSGFFSSGP